jgi:hypothetical protein
MLLNIVLEFSSIFDAYIKAAGAPEATRCLDATLLPPAAL